MDMKPTKKFTPNEMNAIERFRRRELSVEEVTSELGMSKSNFYSMIRRHFDVADGKFPTSNGEPLVNLHKHIVIDNTAPVGSRRGQKKQTKTKTETKK